MCAMSDEKSSSSMCQVDGEAAIIASHARERWKISIQHSEDVIERCSIRAEFHSDTSSIYNFQVGNNFSFTHEREKITRENFGIFLHTTRHKQQLAESCGPISSMVKFMYDEKMRKKTSSFSIAVENGKDYERAKTSDIIESRQASLFGSCLFIVFLKQIINIWSAPERTLLTQIHKLNFHEMKFSELVVDDDFGEIQISN